VSAATLVLLAMAAGSACYGIAGLALMPGIVDRFRGMAGVRGVRLDDIDAGAMALRIVPVTAAVVGVAAAVLLAGLVIGLRRGGNGFRVATWVACGLGAVGGVLAAVVGFLQRFGGLRVDGADTELFRALADAHPAWWLWFSATLPVLQAVGYVLVAALLAMPAANAYFRRTPPPAVAAPPPPPQPVDDPTYWQRPETPAAT